MEKAPMTAAGFDRLDKELWRLKNEERHSIIQAISEAREHGDLSENAEYHAAKERQSLVEGRIQDLESKLSRAQVIEAKDMAGDTVKFGATIKVVDEEDEEMTFQIVGVDEANIKQNLLSNASPLARGMMGKKVGDEVEVNTPRGGKSYELLAIEFK
jgi:transcription elongation factor GreA